MATTTTAFKADRKVVKSGVRLSTKAAAAWDEVRDNGSSINWLLVHLVKKKLKLMRKGIEGFPALTAHLEDPSIALYGVFAFNGGTKFAFMSYIGADVSGMQRAGAGMKRSGAALCFDGTIADISFTGEAGELDCAAVAARLGGTDAEFMRTT